MNIREAKIGDYKQVVSLLCQFAPLSEHANRIKEAIVDSEKQVVFNEIVESANSRFVIAVKDDLVVSMCYLNIIPTIIWDKRPYAFIEHLITDLNHREKGIGRQVLEHAIKLAKEANCYKIMLTTGSDNLVSHQFYKSCGFESDSKTAFVMRST